MKIIILLAGFVLSTFHAQAERPVLHAFEPKYADRYMVRGHLKVQVHAQTMEEAIAQVVYFYENYGWGIAENFPYSGIALLYERAPLPPKVRPFHYEIRTGAIQKVMDFLTNKTQGAFRSQLFDNRVVVIRKQTNTLLFQMDIDKLELSGVPMVEALQSVLHSANHESEHYNIRLEVPPVIHPREGYGPSDWLIYQGIRREALHHKISIDINGNKLIYGLTDVLMAQPIPYYLVLEEDTVSGDYTHVLRFGSLPAAEVKGVDTLHSAN